MTNAYISGPCVDFLKDQAQDLNLKFQVVGPVTIKKPIVILTLPGTQPELKTIALSSHMDVVPVFEVISELKF